MLKRETVSFINNLAKVSSSFASATGRSVIAAEAYEKKNYLSDFAQRYAIPAEGLQLTVSEETPEELVRKWLCGEGKGSWKDRTIAREFGRLLRKAVGEAKSVSVLGGDRSVLEQLSRTDGDGPRYVVEDLFFAVYKEGTLCFLRGRSV